MGGGDRIIKRPTAKEYQRLKRKNGLVDKTQEFKEWREANPEAYKAQQLANYAEKKGEIKKQPCEICKSEIAYKHHPDYSKPLEVVWLCPSCHKKLHLGILIK